MKVKKRKLTYVPTPGDRRWGRDVAPCLKEDTRRRCHDPQPRMADALIVTRDQLNKTINRYIRSLEDRQHPTVTPFYEVHEILKFTMGLLDAGLGD